MFRTAVNRAEVSYLRQWGRPMPIPMEVKNLVTRLRAGECCIGAAWVPSWLARAVLKRAARASPAHFDRSALCAPASAHRPRKSDFPSRVVLLHAASLMRRCIGSCAVRACQRAVRRSALVRPAAPSPPRILHWRAVTPHTFHSAPPF